MKRYCSGAAVWLQPVGAHLITSCRDGDGDLSGPRAAAHRRPTSAHAGVSGETRAVVTWTVMPWGWTRGQPAANQWGYWGGSWAGQGTPVQRRRHGPDCRGGAKNWGRMWPRWAVAPLGFRQLR